MVFWECSGRMEGVTEINWDVLVESGSYFEEVDGVLGRSQVQKYRRKLI